MLLNVKAFAATCGLLWGACLFLLTWWLLLFGGDGQSLAWLGNFYFGYKVSPAGSLIGLAWGLADGAIAGFLFALVYNFFVRRLSRSSGRTSD